MYDLHAYARARQIEMEQSLRKAYHAGEAFRILPARPQGKLIRLFARDVSRRAEAA